MIAVRKAHERGHANHGWLNSYHTFSFANYFDPDHMGFSVLRVINDDTVAPGAGFGTHGHRDMEIISYVLDGALEHKDSMGNGSAIRPGEVQRMSAGTGVTHSEYNGSDEDAVHFLQIWVLPDRSGHKPGYEQKAFSEQEPQGQLRLLVSPDGRDGSLSMNQDAFLYGSLLADGESVTHAPAAGRKTYVHMARGQARLGEHELSAGDGVAIEGEREVTLTGKRGAEVLLFDLP